MWKRKLNWKNDSIEFTFQDQVVSLEESILDDEMWFKASMKNGNQIKKVELRMTINTVHEENNNPVKAEEQEFDEFEQPGSFLNPIKLEEDSNELTDAHMEKIEDFKQKDNAKDAISTPSGGPTAAKAADIKKKVVDIQGLGNNNVTIIDGQLIDQPPNHAEADTIARARKLIAGDTKLGNGSPVRGSNKDITFDNNLSREREYILAKYLSSEDDDEDGMIEEAFKEDEASEHECEEGELNVRENLEPSHTEGGSSAVQPDETDDSHPDDQGGFVRNLRKRRKPVDGSQSASQPCSTSRSKKTYTFDSLTKKYRCRVCNKEFNLAQAAMRHNRSIHMGIRYPCTSCGKSFMRPGGLWKHTKIYHKGV